MTSNEARKQFLEFFKDRGHKSVDSSPLVPQRDPSLLFTSAGMVQFKPYYRGLVPLPYTRAVSVQKCLRVSDLEWVGKTVRHETFFEMLGNFSFGDYFKKQAIEWGWEFLVEVLKMDPGRLSVTVYKKDDEAYDLWRNHMGLDDSLVHRLGEDSNFWGPAGDTGPCGPCSEIFYDMGEGFSCGRPDCKPGCDCDRYFELWNLVFPEFDKTEDGRLLPLANRGIDTGMGLERLAVSLQNGRTVFDTDLFKPIIDESVRIIDTKYSKNEVAFNIIADHVRALTFACSEGVVPSNEGRGYVLRRLLRRALRRGVSLGMEEPFLYRLVGTVADVMKEPFPELAERREQISLLLKSEEERFFRTLGQGLALFEEITSAGTGVIPGDDAFRLYDTYGFPIDMTVEMAEERKLKVDLEGFEEKMTLQRERARAASRFYSPEEQGKWHEVESGISDELRVFDSAGVEISGPPPFSGYEKTRSEANVTGWRCLDDGVEIRLDTTPFYAESGGQVGDTGRIYSDDFEVRVTTTIQTDQGIVHAGKLVKGEVVPGGVTAEVDRERRMDIARNHTATHLLQSALRAVLGKHVRQEGSLVEQERLRFDFTHYNPLAAREIDRIEERVNESIRRNLPVESMTTTHERATKEMAAIALFGEKYGEKVRVIRIGELSTELCGGTHLGHTGEIGLFKIVRESAVAAGIRRIEAVTGKGAYEYIRREEKTLKAICDALGSTSEDLEEKFGKTVEEQKVLRKRVRQLESKLASVMAVKLVGKARHVLGIKVLSSIVEFTDVVGLRQMADEARSRVKENCAGVFGSSIEGKAVFVAFVTDDLTGRLKAGDLAREVAKIIGGGGGGKATIAEAGAKDAHRIDEAIRGVPEVVKGLLENAG
jgi:alanyl-tRNA synthetase